MEAWESRINPPPAIHNPEHAVQAIVEARDGCVRLQLNVGAEQAVHRAAVRLPWQHMGAAITCRGLLSFRDVASYYKNIVHRALVTHSWHPAAGVGRACRLCGQAAERIGHLAFCRETGTVWARWMGMVHEHHPGAPPTHRLILLGVLEDRSLIMNTLNALRILIWKFIILQFTRVDLEGARFDPETIWAQAVRRLLTRLNAAEWAARLAASSRPRTATNAAAKAAEKAAPLATITEQGLTLGTSLAKAADEAGVKWQAKWQDMPTPKARARTVRMQRETLPDDVGEVQHDPVSDRDGHAWHVTCILMTQKEDGQIRIFLQRTADQHGIVAIREGEMLPIREPPGLSFVEAMRKAVRRAGEKASVAHARPQLFLFAPGAGKEESRDHALDLIDAGLQETRQISTIQQGESDHNIDQEMRTIQRMITMRDIWSLRGPAVVMDDQR